MSFGRHKLEGILRLEMSGPNHLLSYRNNERQQETVVNFKFMITARVFFELVYKLTANFQHISLIVLITLNCKAMIFSRADNRVRT